MNKIVFFLFFILLSLSYIFDIDRQIIRNFNFINSFKNYYYEKAIISSNFIDEYFEQSAKVEEYRKENLLLKNFQYLYNINETKYHQLLKDSKIKKQTPTMELVKVLSYVKFNDFTKVWLDKNKTNDKILALIDNEYAAGIVIQHDNKSLALLNGNEKSNYAVYIGENEAPGIVHQNEDEKEYLKIKYIPIWINIKINDEVITSGMDNIFYKGLKVGKVVKINKMADMQEAIIKPYSQVYQKRFFYTYEHVDKKNIQEKSKKTKK